MMVSMTPEQIELNCRRLYKYGPDKLVADSFGTLHRQTHWYQPFSYIYDNLDLSIANGIPQSSIRNKNIKNVVIETLRAASLALKNEPLPISFFFMPGIYNGMVSYKTLALRVNASKSFKEDEDIQNLVQEVLNNYASVKYELDLPEKLSSKKVRIANEYVLEKMNRAFHGSVDLRRKTEIAAQRVKDFNAQYSRNQISSLNGGQTHSKKWLYSEIWKRELLAREARYARN